MLKTRTWKTVESTEELPKEIVNHSDYSPGDFWMSKARISSDGIIEIEFDDYFPDGMLFHRWEFNKITKEWIRNHSKEI